jgi:hypothetical protein
MNLANTHVFRHNEWIFFRLDSHDDDVIFVLYKSFNITLVRYHKANQREKNFNHKWFHADLKIISKPPPSPKTRLS